MINSLDWLAWIGQRIGKPPGWERVVRWFAGPERFQGRSDICVVANGLAFVAQPFVPLGWHVAMFGDYEPELRTILKALLGPGGMAIDVGANVGWHTLLMADRVGSSGRVLAIEANPSIRVRLAENVAINRLNQVEIVPCAAAASAGQLEFWGPSSEDAESGNGYVVTNAGKGAPGEVFAVESRTIDEIVTTAGLDRVDVIKIDVEGFEWPVLLGAEATLSRFRPHVFFEYVDEYAHRGAGSPGNLAEYFDRHGYKLFALRRNWSEQIATSSWPQCADIWAVPLGALGCVQTLVRSQ